MKKIFMIICLVFLFASCYIFDGLSDISVSLNSPDEIVVVNNARVSTLRLMDGEITRDGASVYRFHFEVDVPAGHRETVKIDDFVIKDGDNVFLTDAVFSWDM